MKMAILLPKNKLAVLLLLPKTKIALLLLLKSWPSCCCP